MDQSMILLGKAGFLLFSAGIVTGAVISKLRNPRMALSAHLTAVQTGPALMAFALFWPYLGVPQTWMPILVYSLLISAYALFGGIFLAACWGASKALPIAGQGFYATKLQEFIVSTMVRGSSLIMLASCAVISFFAIAGNFFAF